MTVEGMEGTEQSEAQAQSETPTETMEPTAAQDPSTADVAATAVPAAAGEMPADASVAHDALNAIADEQAMAHVEAAEMADAPVADVEMAAEPEMATAEPELATVETAASAADVEMAAEPEVAADEMADAPAADVEMAAEPETATQETVEAPAADAPVAESATDAPVAESATDAPVAESATDAPVAESATDAPVAESADAPVPAPKPAPRVYDGPEPTTMEELLNEQQTEIRSLKHGDVVEGNVVRIDKDEILVDIGAKSEGVISNRELYGRNAESQPPLNIGDQVLVYVLQPESPEGHAVLSLRRAGLERKWRAMQEQLDAGVIIEAPVIDHNKGGLIVDCGIRGFVPISQIVDFPRRPQNEQPRDAAQEIAEKLQPYVGRKLRLKILEVNRKANRLILSEKVALYEERREKRDELFSSLQVGQKVTGVVRSIAPFGVFVDLGGIDGLVHKSELSWNKVNNPEAGYRVGEEVEAEVIDINHERGRISLSIRRLQPDPWHSTVADLKVGDVIDGTVTKIVNFGAFVRVRDGLEGLIHISELSHQRIVHPGDVVHEGQTIKLKIISLEQDRHRLGLSLKQAEEAPARPEQPAASGGAATGGGAPERRERRPRGGGDRGERGGSYDMSKAVQEPEGGIDNTLAAAFAQVKQQMEQTEAAREASDTEDAEKAAKTETKTKAKAAAKAELAEIAEEAPAKPAAKAKAAKADSTDEPAAKPAAKAKAAKPKAEAKPATTKAAAKPAAKAATKPAAKAKATKAAPEKPAAKKPAASKTKTK
ncbi:MAG: 30S ribosomal protein S1 [Chloroflexota bacterium]